MITINIKKMITMKSENGQCSMRGTDSCSASTPTWRPEKTRFSYFLGACIKEVLSFENSLEI